MGVYVGDIYVPVVSEFSVDSLNKTTEVVKHISQVTPSIAEFRRNTRSAEISGKLLQLYGTVKTADQYAEDIQAMIDRASVYNCIHDCQGRTGWLAVSDGDIPDTVSIVRDYSLTGLFLPKTKYQPRYKTSPQIRSNPWGFSLGSDGCENFIALPIGASYSGGDGEIITRSSEDGIISMVKATVNNTITFDVSTGIDTGEVKVFDDMGEVSESEWLRVFYQDHTFVGKTVIQNGLYRIILDTANNYITL